MLSNREVYWRSHLEKAHAAGLSIRAYADANQLAVASMYQWNRRLRRTDTTEVGGFEEVDLDISESNAEECGAQAWLNLSELDHAVLCRIVQAVAGQSYA